MTNAYIDDTGCSLKIVFLKDCRIYARLMVCSKSTALLTRHFSRLISVTDKVQRYYNILWKKTIFNEHPVQIFRDMMYIHMSDIMHSLYIWSLQNFFEWIFLICAFRMKCGKMCMFLQLYLGLLQISLI